MRSFSLLLWPRRRRPQHILVCIGLVVALGWGRVQAFGGGRPPPPIHSGITTPRRGQGRLLLAISKQTDGNDNNAANNHVNVNRRQHGRRTVLTSLAGGWMAMGAVVPVFSRGAAAVAASEPPLTTKDLCQSGALLPEQAITGAYEQECMQLAVREIPLAQTQPRVALKMAQGTTGAGATGMAVWNASLLLSRLLQELHRAAAATSWSSLRIVELGCGTGLASLTAAALGAKQVLATDGNPTVVALARENILANDLQTVVQGERLPWGLLDAMDYADEPFDLVLGSDLTYQSQNWPALAQTMATLVTPNDGCILYLTLGHAGFSVQAELAGFLAVAQQYGLSPVTEAPAWWKSGGSVSTNDLTRLVYQTCVRPSELDLVQSTGGIGVLLLQKKQRSFRL